MLVREAVNETNQIAQHRFVVVSAMQSHLHRSRTNGALAPKSHSVHQSQIRLGATVVYDVITYVIVTTKLVNADSPCYQRYLAAIALRIAMRIFQKRLHFAASISENGPKAI